MIDSNERTMLAGVRLPAKVIRAFRIACALYDTTSQDVLARAVYDFLAASGIDTDKAARSSMYGIG